jgi:hypothetical protein
MSRLFTRRPLVLSVQTERREAAGEGYFWHAIHGFGASPSLEVSGLITRFFFSLAEPDERLLLAFYLVDGDPLDRVLDLKWMTFKRVAGINGRRSWMVGSTLDETTFARIYQLARDFAFGDPVIAAVAPATENGEFLYACHWEIGLGDEALLLPSYRTVANVSYDAAQLSVVSVRFDRPALVERLQALSRGTGRGIRVEA